MTAAKRLAVICLYGPTASGKTEFALQCADAFGCELVSVDSALVYRGLDIGTAKPDAVTQAQYPHKLVDVVDPWEHYSAADFCRDAAQAIRDAHAAGRVPLLVGGTMLYFRALLEGLNTLPASDPVVRSALQRALAEEGLAPLRAELARVDPALHARLSDNDTQRTLRGLEVWRMTGRPLSVWHAEPRVLPLPLEALELALWPEPRASLHHHIEVRFDAMLELGFLDEVDRLRSDPRMHADLPSMRSVGYRQAWQFRDGACDFDRFRARAIAATRQLAKRQFTWLRSLPTVPRHNPYHAVDGYHPFLQRITTWLEAVSD
ncbi:MAG: tRNA (adenosine(37)-N6)-dimethylallyltransferase MiaA [Pseudomonadota bacterium]